jgi:hypothetical protein
MGGNGNFMKASGSEDTGELGFVGEAKNLGGVPGRGWHFDVLEKGSNHGGEKSVLRGRTPNEERDAPVGFQDAANFGEGLLGIRKEHDAEAAGNAIERGAGKGEMLRVGGAKLHVGEAVGAGVFLSGDEHFGYEIGGDNAAVGADSLCESEGGLTGPTGKVEDVETGGELGTVEDEAGGGTRLEGELVKPLLPKGSGFKPFLTDDFLGVGRGYGIRTQVSPPAWVPRAG